MLAENYKSGTHKKNLLYCIGYQENIYGYSEHQFDVWCHLFLSFGAVLLFLFVVMSQSICDSAVSNDVKRNNTLSTPCAADGRLAMPE